jgi:hypothetical protein
MKKNYLVIAFGLLISGCMPIAYQVIETKPVQEQASGFQNSEVLLSYDFWNSNQMGYFKVYNKTDRPLYLDLDRSHIIINGQSMDYYQDGEEKSSTRFVSSSYYYTTMQSAQVVKTVTSKMKKVVEIPPKSFVAFQGLQVLSAPIVDCDIAKINSKPVSKPFTPENSPLRFRNYLTYSTSPELLLPQVFENSFYAATISNMSELSFLGKSKIFKDCPTDASSKTGREFPYQKPENFFIKH